MIPSRDFLQAAQNCSWQSYRLPTIVLPVAYRLTLQTVLEDQANVNGHVEIDMHAVQPTHCIVLHAVGMTVGAISAVTPDGAEQQGRA